MPNVVFVSVSGTCFVCCILVLAPNVMLVSVSGICSWLDAMPCVVVLADRLKL